MSELHCPNCGHLVNVNIQGNLIPIHITKLRGKIMNEDELQKWINYALGTIDAPRFSPNDILEIIKVDQHILKRILLGRKFEEEGKWK